MKRQKQITPSFVMCGFECTNAQLSDGTCLDLLHKTLHDEKIVEDYKMIKRIGINAVREGFSWKAIDKGNGEYDFSQFLPMLATGRNEEIFQIWDLNHFDYPPHLDPFSHQFIVAFREYAKRVIEVIRKYSETTAYIVPFNEISFFSWFAGEIGAWAPFTKGVDNSSRLKQQCVKAAIEAMRAIKQIDNNVKFIHVDPFMRRVAEKKSNDEIKAYVKRFNTLYRWEAWDMISGGLSPELGGSPEYLDVLGMNYYLHNQEWVSGEHEGNFKTQVIPLTHPDRKPLSSLLRSIIKRYKKPILITETGSHGRKRSKWWKYILDDVDKALKQNMPLLGLCAYPALDMINDTFILPNSGLWDFRNNDRNLARIGHRRTLHLIKEFVKKYPHSPLPINTSHFYGRSLYMSSVTT